MTKRPPVTKPKYGRTDANHAEVIGWFLEMGCTVRDTSQVGLGFPDIVVGTIGRTILVEIKTADGDLLPSQHTFNAKWRGERPYLVRTQVDCIDLVQRIRKGK
jgi:hypothetical protein